MPKLYFRPKPISIVSDSVKYVAICSSYGDVLLWYYDSNDHQDRPPIRVWNARYANGEAYSAAIADSGTLILSTREGNVYVGHPRPGQRKYKFGLIRSHAVRHVYAGISGSYAFIREERLLDIISKKEDKINSLDGLPLFHESTDLTDVCISVNETEIWLHRALLYECTNWNKLIQKKTTLVQIDGIQDGCVIIREKNPILQLEVQGCSPNSWSAFNQLLTGQFQDVAYLKNHCFRRICHTFGVDELLANRSVSAQKLFITERLIKARQSQSSSCDVRIHTKDKMIYAHRICLISK